MLYSEPIFFNPPLASWGLTSCYKIKNKLFVNYFAELPNGSEEGTYLALDLGGTNFRVMLMEMSAGKILKEEVAYYMVQDQTRLGPGKYNKPLI